MFYIVLESYTIKFVYVKVLNFVYFLFMYITKQILSVKSQCNLLSLKINPFPFSERTV